MASEHSIVEYFPGNESHRCGYCGNSNSNYSHGMWTHTLTCQDYQDLIDRGWRRSGKYTYKPTMNKTCCPAYTIKCQANNFKLTKSNKKVIKLVNRYLLTGQKPGDKSSEETKVAKDNPKDHGQDDVQDGATPAGPKNADQSDEINPEHAKHTGPKGTNKGVGADPNKPPRKKSKDLRLERKRQREKHPDSDDTNMVAPSAHHLSKGASNKERSLEELLDEPMKFEQPAHKLEIKLVRSSPPSAEMSESLQSSYLIYQKYQMEIHKDRPDECDMDCFTRFLVESPLEDAGVDDVLPDGYGSFHQQYLLDGKIICVGVIDILPNCVSSVYLYYDTDYQFLSLGTYSALRELAFTRSLSAIVPDLQYYYMGYYIHSCPKMKYKGHYEPSFLLCPETYTWNPIERCRPLLDANRYSRLNEDPQKTDGDGEMDVNDVLILHGGQAMPYAIYKAVKPRSGGDKAVGEYAAFVGKKCATRMLLYRS